MIAAMEKSKLVYILNRDATANLIISCPLSVRRTETLLLSITFVGVDVGFETPMFARWKSTMQSLTGI
jgi:splicing factor 3B subunit 3